QSDWERTVRNSGKLIRNVFWESSRYRYTGVTRNDIAANNAVARNAIEKFGELPQDILEGTKRGKFAPKIYERKK
ncbi:MAG: AcaB family transcriptional regulator, partial [Pseudomonadota bacterium]